MPRREPTLVNGAYLRTMVNKTAAMQHTADLALARGDPDIAGQVLTELHDELAPLAAEIKERRRQQNRQEDDPDTG